MRNYYVTWHNAWGKFCSRGCSSIQEAFEFAKSADLVKFNIV